MKPLHTSTQFAYRIVFLSVATIDFTEQSKNQCVGFICDKEILLKVLGLKIIMASDNAPFHDNRSVSAHVCWFL